MHDNFYIESSFVVVFLSLFFVTVSRNWMQYSYITLWMLGAFISWILAYWLYRYNYGQLSDTDFLRPFLFNIFLIGLIIANILVTSKKVQSQKSIIIKGNSALVVFLILLLITYVYTGGINSREDNEFASDFSGFYFVQAFLFLFYLGSYIAGYTFRLNIYLLIFLGIVTINLLGNHRGETLVNIIFFMAGLFFNSRLTRSKKILIYSGLILFGASAFIVIGQSRLKESNSQNQYTANQFAIERVLEPSGQVVIDKTYKRKTYDGFENFDRIITMPIPAFLIGGKKPNDDSNEVLVEKYGYSDLGKLSSIPIPFIADSYRRFGVLGVLFFSIIFGFVLNKISQMLLRSSKEWVIVSFFLLSIYVLKIYPLSVLGTISFFLYTLPKLIIVILVLYSIRPLKPRFHRERNIC